MDFEYMKRKELQALCKEHGIPANLTNLEMANKLSSLLKVNDEKPLTRGRSCLKVFDDNVNDRESDVVVNRKVKKVKFSPDNEIIEFTRSVQVKRRGRRNSMLRFGSDGLNIGILDSPVRVTRSVRMNLEDGVTEKKRGKRGVKDGLVSVNDEVGVTTRRTLRNKVVVIEEKREENEGVDDGLRMSRRVRSRKNAKESAEDMKELDKSKSEKGTDRAEKRDKKVSFVSDDQLNECTKSETKAKETKRESRRKSMAHNKTLHVQNEVDAEVREEVAEKPARVTRSRNIKPVEDNVGNKRNRTGGKEAMICTEFVESSVEAVKDDVRVNTRRSQQNSEVEAPQKALKRSGRVANKEKGARLSDDISKEKMVTRGRTRNHSNLTVEASTSESGTKIVGPKGKLEPVLQLEELVEVPLRRSDRRKSVFPLEKLRGDEVVAKKEKRNFLNANDDEQSNKGTKEEPQKALKRSKRLATQVEGSVLAKDDITANEVPDRGRSNRRKSVVPSLEKVRSDEAAVVKEERNLNANDDDIRSKGTKEETQKALKRSKSLAKQMEDHVLAKGDLAENKLEERRCSRRNAAKGNVDTKMLDRSVQEETSVVKEERRRSGRSAARHTLAVVSNEKKENGENKLTKRNCIVIQEKDSTNNKLALQDLDSLIQSTSSSKASVEAAVVEKNSTAGKKQQGRLKRSNVEVEVPMPEDMEIIREPHNKDCNISGSEGTMSFSRSALNELEAVPSDVNIVLAETKDGAAAESSTLADKLNEEGALVDANDSPSENNSASKCHPFNSDARPEENLVEELLQSDHEASAIRDGPSSVLADDAVPNDITSDQQEHGAEEFVSNEVLDNCSLSQSDNMEENRDSGTKDEAAAELSTLAEKLNEEGPLVDANASPSENNSTLKCLPFSDPFNSDARPEENLVEELLQSDHEASASKDLCPSSVLSDDGVPNDITPDKQEHGAMAADSAEVFDTRLSNEVLDNCSVSQSDNMEENLDSGFKEQSETGGVVTEGVTYGEQEPASKCLCPSPFLSDDAVPNVLTSDKLEHGAMAAENAKEFDTGSSNEVLNNCSGDNTEEKFDSGFKEQSETPFNVAVGVNYGEQELTVTDYAKEFDSGLSSSVSLENVVAFNQSNEMEVKYSESGPMEQAEAESGPMEDKYDQDAPIFTNQGEIHAEEYANLEAATSKKIVSSTTKAVLDLQVAEPGVLGVGIKLHVTHSGDGDDEKQGEELKILFATPCHVSHSKEEKKASLDGDSRDKGLNREEQVSPICGNDTSSLQSSVRNCGEHEQGEILKNLFATPFGSRSSKVAIATSIEINKTSSQYKYSCHEDENIVTSAGNGLTESVTPLKDTSNDEAGEELKDLFATPSVASQSVGGQYYDFQSQLSGDAMTMGGGLGSSGRENLSEFVGGLVEDKQGEHERTLVASPVSVKCSNQETSSTKGKYSQSHEMETYICSGVKINLGECEDRTFGVDQAPEASHITAFNYGDENEQEDQLKMLFASPIITQTVNQMDGTSRKTEDKENLLSRNVQGLSHNKGFSVENIKETAECIDSKHSEEQIIVEKINETAECMKESSDLEEENNEGWGNMLSATSAKKMSPLRIDEFSSQELKIEETPECMKESSALEEEIKNQGQGNMLSASSTKNMTPLRNAEFSSQEPETSEVALSGEMVRDTGMNTRHESWVQEIVDIEEHKIEETVAEGDLLLRDTSKGLEEDICVEIANKSTSPVISEPTCDDIAFSEQQMVPEINKSSPEIVKRSDTFTEGTEDHLKLLFATPIKETSPSSPESLKPSDAFNEDTEDHLKLLFATPIKETSSCSESLKPSDAFNEENTEDHLKLSFATPIKGTSPSRLAEASSCQLKTDMIINEASEMVGKEPKLKGFEFSGEPLTVEIISGGSDSTQRSCFSKEIKEQSERGPLFPTPSKVASPLQLEESPGCEDDIFKDLDGGKFLGSHEQIFARHEDHQLLNEMTDETGEVTLDWFQTNNGSVPSQPELEMQKENDSAHQFEPLHEKGEVTEDASLTEGKGGDHLVAYQESLEDRLINTDEAAKGGADNDAVCQQPNILTDIETENITKTDVISVSAESGIVEFDAESTTLRSQEKIIITVEETKGDEVQKLEVRNISNAFLHNIPNNDEYAKEITTVLPADEQFHFPEHHVIDSVSSTEEFTASANECQVVFKEDDLAVQGDGLIIFESNERMSMNVNGSGLTTQHEDDSFDKKEHESTEAVLSPSSKSHENISFIEEGFAGEVTLMSEKKSDLAEIKVPLTPADVGKTSFAKHLNSTVRKKNARSILIHGTPNKLSQNADMKENAPSFKGDIGTLTASRPEKRGALKILPWK